MQNMDVRIESWKKKLLDLGKRNRLINFKETKRSDISILTPSVSELFNLLVNEEKVLSFSYPIEIGINQEYNMFEADGDNAEIEVRIIEGDLSTNQSIKEQQKTLKSLREKAKTAIEEQGVNVLYLAFGFLNWKEGVGSSQSFTSPLILVPVSINMESLTSPYKIELRDDDIVLNPTLKYKLENDFNIALPDFDSESDAICGYLAKVTTILKDYNWQVDEKVSLALFSYLKINMYMDLHRKSEVLKNNFAVKALCGDVAELPNVLTGLNDYEHDKKDRPIDVFQTVDADSSQQDAILLSKKGVSFVLQGPPGTGKSQTITNIISEALADGKKVLFVSEKMAALEVVYNRLSKVGLGDFCLTLHNHKANKKEILKNLGDTFNVNRIKIKDEALYELEVLQREREALNNYASELHIVVMPMEKSIYQINGILAKLKNIPNIIFDLENIKDVSASQLRNYEYLLERFSKTVGKLTEDYDSNVWKGSDVTQVTHELRQDIERRASRLIIEFQKFIEKVDASFKTLTFDELITFGKLREISELFLLCENAYKVPKDWLDRDDIKSISETVLEFSKKQKIFDSSTDFINNNFDSSVYSIDMMSMKSRLEHLYNNIFENNASYQSQKEIIENTSTIIPICEQSISALTELQNIIKKVNEPISLPLRNNPMEIEGYVHVLTDLNKSFNASNLWFDKNQLEEAIARCDELAYLSQRLNNDRETLFSKYENDILRIDYEGILRRFKTEYTSIFKIFKPKYKKDLREIRAYSITPIKKISDSDAIAVLSSIKSIKEKECEFENKELASKELLGKSCNGQSTDFSKLKSCLLSFKTIMEYVKFDVSNSFKDLVLSGTNQDKFSDDIIKIQELLKSSDLSNGYNILKYSSNVDIIEVADTLVLLKDNITCLISEYNTISTLATSELSFDTINDSISKLCTIQKIKNELKENEAELKETFKFMFYGTETNWEEIKSSLEWTAKFRPFMKDFNLSEDFISKIISLEYKKDILEVLLSVKDLKSTSAKDFEWFNSLYEKDYQLWELPISNVINKLKRCISNLHGLEEWIDFKNTRKECYANDLGNVVDVILSDKIPPEHITNSFKKRFYKLWLDSILPNYPAVVAFRRKSHEDMIERFKEFDKKQMDIAKLRVKERILSKLPDANKTTSAVDEVGILKRELAKQRKIMPIRKLFARIPTLLPALKPCLMMSPLSVSLFLESELYNFDLVIFDEASQVCTENAIGAIMRSKQIIVAGDNKQLPPTSFFNSTTSNADYDVDNEEDFEDGDYESILDEMLTSFPERSLKWHYRSKNEELITFSNVKIYNQSLITFPSSAEKVPNNGVEYVYVEDGIYDRGAKKNNINEAKKVAEMVFKHFKNSSDRSIGVIAFSSSQQQAIDEEVTKLRLANPMFESFFKEDKEEPFFIKNLENVQGDERDTIIFSIGYAKDSKGVMYMNFGPLSRNGGYRRLNVAITRAKYNIKLVGSIRPTDIKSDINAEGVKMLRSYIEFAINGKSVLENELNYNKYVDVDSPFEEAVYDFLVSKGYKVTTQVGCSGYRIDMAVKHPTLDGRFVIGVECDGATYHSSRTARERDRLRQSILEDMGWKFHRIWSTDWIKDPVIEGERLVNAVERSIATYVDSFEKIEVTHNNLQEDTVEDYYETQENVIGELSSECSRFDIYTEGNAFSARGGDYGLTGLCRAIKQIIDIEYPIHYDLLCKRIAPIYGNQKATVKIRNEVNYGLNYIKDEIIRNGDFIYPKDYNKVNPKTPPQGELPRVIAHISDDEIGAAMLLIASDSFGLSKTSLFQIVAKEFGFNRTGVNINNAFDKVFNSLVSENKINYAEDKIVLI